MSTMFAALHGELAVHPWRQAASSDAYSLFVARSSAMGWLAEPGGTGGRWGMNDAGQGPGSRVAWFQVALPEPRVPTLPVQAFLACAGGVAARIGALRLAAVQVLLPVRALDAESAVMPLLQDAGWFADCDPRARTRVRVTLDGGQDPAIRSAGPEMLRWAQRFEQDVFLGDVSSLTDDADLELAPGIIDELWNGPTRHRIAFHGVLAEWSLDALGWLAAFVAQASAQQGVDGPLMLAISAAGGP
jgi:hypothetical protein